MFINYLFTMGWTVCWVWAHNVGKIRMTFILIGSTIRWVSIFSLSTELVTYFYYNNYYIIIDINTFVDFWKTETMLVHICLPPKPNHAWYKDVFRVQSANQYTMEPFLRMYSIHQYWSFYIFQPMIKYDEIGYNIGMNAVTVIKISHTFSLNI